MATSIFDGPNSTDRDYDDDEEVLDPNTGYPRPWSNPPKVKGEKDEDASSDK